MKSGCVVRRCGKWVCGKIVTLPSCSGGQLQKLMSVLKSKDPALYKHLTVSMWNTHQCGHQLGTCYAICRLPSK